MAAPVHHRRTRRRGGGSAPARSAGSRPCARGAGHCRGDHRRGRHDRALQLDDRRQRLRPARGPPGRDHRQGITVCPANHPNWRAFADRVGPEKAAELFAPMRRMAERGVNLVAGTGAGVPRAVFGGLVSSLEFFEHLGVPRDGIIDMATAKAASALGLDGQTGRLAEGYRAGILVVDGDPLASLDALRATPS
ncbi:amidohydrolase family protein [Streptomyces sp. NRAIS4]